MSMLSMSRKEYVDFLLRKFSSLEANIEQIGKQCEENGKLSEEHRIAREEEIESLKNWMMNQEWRDGVLRSAIDRMQLLVENQDEKIEAENIEQKSAIETLRSEMESVRREVHFCKNELSESFSGSGDRTIDESIAAKVQDLERNVMELAKQIPLTGTVRVGSESCNVEDVLQTMSGWMLKEESKSSELRAQFQELKKKVEYQKDVESDNCGQRSVFGAAFSDLDIIRSGLSEIQSQSQNELVQQDKFNEDVISDLNKLGSCLKELGHRQQKFENAIKENCCLDCDDVKRMSECIMNQVLVIKELQIELAALHVDMNGSTRENESLKIKQELFNKSFLLQLKAMRDEFKNLQDFGNDTSAEMSELRIEVNQLKQQHEINSEKTDVNNNKTQAMIESFQDELTAVRQAYSQLGKHLIEELDKWTGGMEMRKDANRKVVNVVATNIKNVFRLEQSKDRTIRLKPVTTFTFSLRPALLI